MAKVFSGLLAVLLAVTADAQSPILNFLKTDQGLSLLAQEFKLNQVMRADLESDQVAEASAKYRIRRVRIKHSNVGPVRMTLREPVNQKAPLPLVFVIAGLESNLETVKLFPESDRYILAVYEYPVAPNPSQIQFAAQVLQNVPRIQGQIAVGLKWLTNNKDVLADRVNVLMVSFGTFVGPMAMRISRVAMDIPVYSHVLAFGGADIKNLVLPQLEKNLAAADYRAIANPIKQGMDFIDPKHHLPFLTGSVLVVNGQMDSLIPEASSQALIQAAPRSTTVIELPVEHIQPGRADIIRRTYDVIYHWYGEIKALD